MTSTRRRGNPGHIDAEYAARVQTWNRDFCAGLEQIAVGQAAANTVIQPGVRRAAVVVLPQWVWLPPRIDAGKKLQSGAVPVRIEWMCPAVLIVGPNRTRLPRWRVRGMGWNLDGVTAVRAGSFATPEPQGTTWVPRRIVAEPMAVALVRRELAELIEDAHAAQWRLITMLERIAARRMPRAISDVVTEIAGMQVSPESVLDEHAREAMRTQFVLGSDTKEGRLHSIIRRSLIPGAFARVDPMRFVSVDIRRSLEDEVRQHIGDPHIGAKFRRHVDRLKRAGVLADPTMSLDDVLASYNATYPRDSLGERRALAAVDTRTALVHAPHRVEDPEINGEDTAYPDSD